MTSNTDFLGTKNVHRLLFSLALPAVIAMLASGFYSIFSTLMISKGINIKAIGAIGIVFPVQILYHGFAQMISIGAASDISRSLGKKNFDRANQTTTLAYLLTTLISIVLMIGTAFFTRSILLTFGSNQELLPMALEYLNVLIWSIPFNAIVLLSCAVFRAEGNLKQSMVVVLIEAILNLMLEFIFIYFLKLGIKSVALSTIIAQAITSIYALFYISRQKSSVKFQKNYLKPDSEITKSILTVGFSAFARNAATATLSLTVNHTLRNLGGTNSLTAFGAVNRIVTFFFLPIMGVNQGMQPIASYNYGAKQNARVKEALKYGLIYTTAIGVVATLIGLVLPRATIQLFTRNPDIVNEATLIFRLQLIFFWTVGFQTVTSTLYQSLGQAWPALFISIFKQLFILIPLVYFLSNFTNLQLNGVWYSYPIAELLAFIIILMILKRKMNFLTKKKENIVAN